MTCDALAQVILCFSPVGSTLRVRARRFPAVVNCTAIDWFHEWPEDALVSVSSRFLEETGDIEVSGAPGAACRPVSSPVWGAGGTGCSGSTCSSAAPQGHVLGLGAALVSQPAAPRWGQTRPHRPFVLKTPPQIKSWKHQLCHSAARINLMD